jgi:hypothetical protein
MSGTLAFVSPVVAAVLTGCAALAPYPTYPRMAGPGEEATAQRVAAQQECPPDTTATYFDTDWRLQYCPLLLPARATFVCAARK